jgi:transcriptional regulator with XRE-family HTH domain
MAKKTAPLLPSTDALLRQFGDRLRVARLRRRLPAKQVAERAGMAPMTLRSLERGGSGVTMGAYLAVMQVLGIEKDLDLLGKADPVGRELQDAQLTPARATAATPAPLRSRVPASKSSRRVRETAKRADGRPPAIKQPPKPSTDARDWIKKSGFASADALAGLIDPSVSSTPKKRR